ncbi:MAG: HAD family hydrolase [Nitrospiria bacterium]
MKIKRKSLYIVSISIHGLIRGKDLELGRDADTGGQTKYVVDLALALSKRKEVSQIDLVTRRFTDPNIGLDYANKIETLSNTARIVRVDAGPEDYLPKEALWDCLDIFSDNLFNYLNEQPHMPDILHSHYADAGYVGMRLSNLLGIPLVYTGHSLGRDKRRRLLANGFSRTDLEKRYNMSRRIEAEEEVLANADLVITSTQNEIEEQYELYDTYQPERMTVIPPGTDLVKFYPPGKKENDAAFKDQISTFLKAPEKPIILALSRPDERKNIVTLLEAFGESIVLQEMANLVIVMGNREDIREMDSHGQGVLTTILLTIDSYNLYGRVAIPKKHRPEDVPEIYRMAAASRGVFVNPALTEPFGLTLLEAAASGLPVVATENGGPRDIIANCKNGCLVDPLDKQAIVKALLSILKDSRRRRAYAQNGIEGVRRFYSWTTHAERYLREVKPLVEKREPKAPPIMPRASMRYRDRAFFCGLDLNLHGHPVGLKEWIALLNGHRKSTCFGIATARRFNDALVVIKKHGIPMPDVLITGLGTQIHYLPSLTADGFWAEHIEHLWKPKAVERILDGIPGLEPQPKREQSRFKLSYTYDPEKAPSLETINALMHSQEQTVNVIYSFGCHLNVLPVRASKGQALRYFAQRWEIPFERILVAGGSGSDEDMLLGNTLAVVLSNKHHEELAHLRDMEGIYFSHQAYILGILDAIEHYDFFDTCKVPQES